LYPSDFRVEQLNVAVSLAESTKHEEIVRSYSSPQPEHIQAALAYAQRTRSSRSSNEVGVAALHE
jgi:uncharacterized protein (DUF433 family)